MTEYTPLNWDGFDVQHIADWMVRARWNPTINANEIDHRYQNRHHTWTVSFNIPWLSDHHGAEGNDLRETMIAAIEDARRYGHTGDPNQHADPADPLKHTPGDYYGSAHPHSRRPVGNAVVGGGWNTPSGFVATYEEYVKGLAR